MIFIIIISLIVTLALYCCCVVAGRAEKRKRGKTKMNDSEIIKALECCGTARLRELHTGENPCSNCPMQDCEDCEVELPDCALDLINRQQADNERLKKLLKEADINYNKCAKRFYKEGVKEFAERLKTKSHNYYPSIDSYCVSKKVVLTSDIDRLVEEMTEGKENV